MAKSFKTESPLMVPWCASIEKLLIFVVSSILFVSAQVNQARADTFDASASQSQIDVLLDLTDTLQKPVSSSIDGISFNKSSDGVFYINSNYALTGADAPGALLRLGENRPYQNMTFENSSTANRWVLSAISQAGDTLVLGSLSTKSLTLNNTTLALETKVGPGIAPIPPLNYVKDLILGSPSSGPALFSLNNGHYDSSGSLSTKLQWGNDARIDVTGTDNRILAPLGGIDRSFFGLELRLNDNSKLLVTGGTTIQGDYAGFLTLGSGSTLEIEDSQVFLASTGQQSTINNATINMRGIFGADGARLVLTDPQISNSTINMSNNDRFVSTKRTSASTFDVGHFYFYGDNTINMAPGAQLLAEASGVPETSTFFNFYNGKTTINAVNGTSLLRAVGITMDNATLDYTNVNLHEELKFLDIKNNSLFRTLSAGGDPFYQLTNLKVDNSKLSGANDYAEGALLNATFNDATIRIDQASRASGTTFYFNGVDAAGPTGKAKATFTGNNTVVSRIDPNGTDVGVDLGGIITGVKTYSDQVFFTRHLPYTDETTSVIGLANVSVDLEPFALGLTAQDYASGGQNSDGVYDVLIFNKANTATTATTADSDTVGLRLDGNMPAQLTVAQVATPSADQKVSVKFIKLPSSALLSHPSITPSYTAETVTETITEPDTGYIQTITIALTPDSGKATATKTTTTTTTTPSGQVVGSTITTTILEPAQGTVNTFSAAALIDNASTSGNTALTNALGSLTNNQVGEHVDSIDAEGYSSYMTTSLEHTDMVMNSVLAHASSRGQLNTGATKEVIGADTQKRLWVDASYAEGDIDEDGDLGGFDYTLSSFTLGQDFFVKENSTLGAYFSFGTQDMDEHDKDVGDFDSDIYHLGLYLNQSDVGGWDLRGVLGYAYGDNNSKRRIFLSDTSTTAKGNFDSHTAYIGVKGEIIAYQNNWVTLSPEVGANYSYYGQESFKESGNPDLSLKLDSADAQAIIVSTGLNARFANFSDSMPVYPLAFVRYEHDFYADQNSEHEVDAALVSHPDYTQPFVGQNRGANAIITGLGLGSEITSALQMSGGFVYSDNSHGNEWGAGFNLEYLF